MGKYEFGLGSSFCIAKSLSIIFDLSLAAVFRTGLLHDFGREGALYILVLDLDISAELLAKYKSFKELDIRSPNPDSIFE